IVEVSTDFLEKLGVRWSPDGSQTFSGDDFDNAILSHNSGGFRKGFGKVNGPIPVTTGAGTPGATVANTLASVRSGAVESTLSLDFLIQFQRKNTDATVLAEPQVNIADNEVGKLFVGQQVPIPNNQAVSSVGTLSQTFIYKEVGVII